MTQYVIINVAVSLEYCIISIIYWLLRMLNIWLCVEQANNAGRQCTNLLQNLCTFTHKCELFIHTKENVKKEKNSKWKTVKNGKPWKLWWIVSKKTDQKQNTLKKPSAYCVKNLVPQILNWWNLHLNTYETYSISLFTAKITKLHLEKKSGKKIKQQTCTQHLK